MPPVAPVLVVTKRLTASEVARFKGSPFPDMIKFVVDIQLKVLALGGEMHVDAEAALLDRGSDQESLWGGNYYPGLGEGECIRYTSLINIRPAQGNRAMVVESADIRDRMRAVVFTLIGHGEPWS